MIFTDIERVAALDSAENLKSRRGQVLRSARKHAGLSARRLAERINDRTAGSDLTENAIYAYESGRVLLSREAAERIAEVLRLPVGHLLVGDPDYAVLPSASPGSSTEDVAVLPGLSHAGLSPAEVAAWRAACTALAPLGQRLVDATGVLCRQLEVPRFSLPSPAGFSASFELVAADARFLSEHPEALRVRDLQADAWYERPQALVEAGASLGKVAGDQYRQLEVAGQERGNCGPLCADAATKLRQEWDRLVTALGPVWQAAHPR